MPIDIKEIKIGENVWFPVKHEARPHFGEVQDIHPTDKIEPSISVIDLTDGGFRVLPLTMCYNSEAEVKEYRKKILEERKNAAKAVSKTRKVIK